MSDILVTFEDGSTELRADNAPFRHRIPYYDEKLFCDGLPTWTQMGSYVHTFDNCGRSGNILLPDGLDAGGPPLARQPLCHLRPSDQRGLADEAPRA